MSALTKRSGIVGVFLAAAPERFAPDGACAPNKAGCTVMAATHARNIKHRIFRLRMNI